MVDLVSLTSIGYTTASPWTPPLVFQNNWTAFSSSARGVSYHHGIEYFPGRASCEDASFLYSLLPLDVASGIVTWSGMATVPGAYYQTGLFNYSDIVAPHKRNVFALPCTPGDTVCFLFCVFILILANVPGSIALVGFYPPTGTVPVLRANWEGNDATSGGPYWVRCF